jgi:hypothetical protein
MQLLPVGYREKKLPACAASSLTSRVDASLLGVVGCHSVTVTITLCVSALLQAVVA